MSTAAIPPSNRLVSLDALRGFDMFWIMGGESLARALDGFGDSPISKAIARQLEHVEWEGFRFYDLIFPLFVFIVGVSLVFSLGRTIQEHGRSEAMKRIFRRSVLLFAVALFYSGGFSRHWPDIRLLGVLNRIALCYFFAGILFCYLSPRGLAAACAGLLVGYWALMTFVPFPDVRPVDANGQLISQSMTATNTAQLNWNSTTKARGVFEPGFNLANYLDQKYLPGKKWDKTWDPEGLLSTLPAIGTCLLGVLAGLLLKSPQYEDRRKLALLLSGGAICVVAGLLWSIQFPIIKKIWTSSYVLVAGGCSGLLLGLFYWIIDMRHCTRWCQPFVWYGMNPITVYLADNILNFRLVAARVFGGDVRVFLDAHVMQGLGAFVLGCGEIGVGLLIVWFLYRKKIFLRL
ncbi:MAG TPA: heparan-alpha-glucosaminide N-acetyltransferase domain-containing protein [Verrucomicrobiae bacterium]|nr:heparan-alpha-glucosaminide N-acetyltransferase domain-containing protein [Verrucomicrobiae bacterium]